MASIYEPIESDVSGFKKCFYLVPELWDKFNCNGLDNIDFSKWKRIKVMDESGEFSEELKRIPTAYGGIYVYCIVPNVIPNCGCFISYIGMASKTPTENLRRRVRSYKYELGAGYKRDRIHNLFVRWGQYIYVYYLPVNASNEIIEELETRLIGCHVPPCNPEIRDAAVKRKIKAFSEF